VGGRFWPTRFGVRLDCTIVGVWMVVQFQLLTARWNLIMKIPCLQPSVTRLRRAIRTQQLFLRYMTHALTYNSLSALRHLAQGITLTNGLLRNMDMVTKIRRVRFNVYVKGSVCVNVPLAIWHLTYEPLTFRTMSMFCAKRSPIERTRYV